MTKLPIDADELLKNMASEAVKQGENLRATVRDLTLNALRNRELSLAQIKQVVRIVTEGVSAGVAKPKVDVEQAIEDALAGMDDALMKAVDANQLALKQLTAPGQSFEQSAVKNALDELERLEDEWLKTVKQASGSATDQIRRQWASAVQNTQSSGTETGEHVATMMEHVGKQMQTAMREQRRASLKAAHTLSQNFATLASGILTGMSEGMQTKDKEPRK